MDSLWLRLTRSFAMRGFSGTARMCGACLKAMVLPNYRRVEARRRQVDAEFDNRYQVDTGGVYRPDPDAVIGTNWAFGITYQPVDPDAFVVALEALPIRHGDFTFIDFGAGKGRAVLLASRLPFKRILGVEYCPQLAEVARLNLRRFPASEKRCEDIEIVTADATEFSIPEGPLVLFFYNPFGEPVMARVASNVARACESTPRRLCVVYFTPYFASLWENLGNLRRLQESPAIFDSLKPDPKSTASERLLAPVSEQVAGL